MPLLVNAGHKVVVLTRSADRTSQLEQMGAVPVVGDVYDAVRLARLVAESEAEVVIHQLTAFGTKGTMPIAGTGAGTYSFINEALARQQLGDMRVYYMNEQRGASNAKAKREFNWQPAFPSWRTGFEALYLNRPRESSNAV